jgi:hypothetical protein
MKKLLCLLSIILVAFTSCSKDDNESSNSASSVLPKTRINIEDGVSYPAKYVYDGNKITSITDADGSVMKYTYSGNVITKIEELDTKGQPDFITDYIYENGKMTVSIERNVGNDYYYKTKYTYNADGTVSYEGFKGIDSTGIEQEYGATGKYTFKDGNVIKLEVSYYGAESTYIYEYDTKNNPFKNVLGFNLLLDDVAVNNVIKETSTSGSGTTLRTNTKTYAYTYDVNNYPTEKVESYQSETSVFEEITQYVY